MIFIPMEWADSVSVIRSDKIIALCWPAICSRRCEATALTCCSCCSLCGKLVCLGIKLFFLSLVVIGNLLVFFFKSIYFSLLFLEVFLLLLLLGLQFFNFFILNLKLLQNLLVVLENFLNNIYILYKLSNTLRA